jgi:hypothetical protein
MHGKGAIRPRECTEHSEPRYPDAMPRRAGITIALCACVMAGIVMAPAAQARVIEGSGSRTTRVTGPAQGRILAQGTGAQETKAGGAGQKNPKAQTGAGKQQSSGGEPAAGPPWTYQMAKISILLLVLLILSLGWFYFRLVLTRRRRGI